jgi:hypothetical protein
VLLLASLAFALAATVLLVLGLLGDGATGLLWVSVACSGAAAVALRVGLRRRRVTPG